MSDKNRIDPAIFSKGKKDNEAPVFAFVVLEAKDGRIGLSEVAMNDKEPFKVNTSEDQLRVKRNCLALIEMIDRQILRSTVMQALSDAMTQQMKKLKSSKVIDVAGRPIISPSKND